MGAFSGSRSAIARRRSRKSGRTGQRYFDLVRVQDAHARSRCRDLNGTGTVGLFRVRLLGAASKLAWPRLAASSAYNFRVPSSSLQALLGRAGAALERGRGNEATQMLQPALRGSLTREDELAVRSMLARRHCCRTTSITPPARSAVRRTRFATPCRQGVCRRCGASTGGSPMPAATSRERSRCTAAP
jgi:hypothetical protein